MERGTDVSNKKTGERGEKKKAFLGVLAPKRRGPKLEKFWL